MGPAHVEVVLCKYSRQPLCAGPEASQIVSGQCFAAQIHLQLRSATSQQQHFTFHSSSLADSLLSGWPHRVLLETDISDPNL